MNGSPIWAFFKCAFWRQIKPIQWKLARVYWVVTYHKFEVTDVAMKVHESLVYYDRNHRRR